MTNEHEAPVDDPTESQLADLVRAAAAVAVPDAVRAATVGADRPEAGPRAGELWRARHPGGGPVTLVWVRSVAPAGVLVVPVSFDVELADEDTLIVDGEASPLGLALALHLAVETTVDRRACSTGWNARPRVDRRRRRHAARGPAKHPAGLAGCTAATASCRRSTSSRRTGKPSPTVSRPRPGGDDRRMGTGTPGPTGGRSTPVRSGRPPQGRAPDAWRRSHPGARIAPRPAATAGSEHLSAVALVAELDAFVLVAVRRIPSATVPSATIPQATRPGSRPPGRPCTPTSCSTPSAWSSRPRRSCPSWSTGATSWRPSRRRPASSDRPARAARRRRSASPSPSSSTPPSARSAGWPARSSRARRSSRGRWRSTCRPTPSAPSKPPPRASRPRGSAPGYERVKRHQDADHPARRGGPQPAPTSTSPRILDEDER